MELNYFILLKAREKMVMWKTPRLPELLLCLLSTALFAL